MKSRDPGDDSRLSEPTKGARGYLHGHSPVVFAYAAAYISDSDDMAEGAEVDVIAYLQRTRYAIACCFFLVKRPGPRDWDVF